jgi:hypothetical protein
VHTSRVLALSVEPKYMQAVPGGLFTRDFFPGRGNAHTHAHEVDEDHLFFKHNLFRTLGINSFRTPAKLQTRIESEFWAHVLGKIRAHVKRD